MNGEFVGSWAFTPTDGQESHKISGGYGSVEAWHGCLGLMGNSKDRTERIPAHS